MHDSYDCDYTFRNLDIYHRHLVPGAYAQVVVDDLFHPSIRSETAWLKVLGCSEQGVYLGMVSQPLPSFPEIQLGEPLYFWG